MQNFVISATKEGTPSRPETPATPRSRSLTPKSRRIIELEEKNARLEGESKKQTKALEESKILRDCEKIVAKSNESLSKLKNLRVEGMAAIAILKMQEKKLKNARNLRALVLVGSVALTGAVAAGTYIAATGGVLCTKTLVSLGTVSAFTTIPVGSLIIILSEICGGALILGILGSYNNFKEFSENNYKVKITQSQILNLEIQSYCINKCEATVENKQYIIKNLLNQKEIDSKVCEDARISLSNACDNLDRAIEKLKGFVHEIYSGGY